MSRRTERCRSRSPRASFYLRGRSGGPQGIGQLLHPADRRATSGPGSARPGTRRPSRRRRERWSTGTARRRPPRCFGRFRVCDPAMGSGHFLVDALDVLTDRDRGVPQRAAAQAGSRRPRTAPRDGPGAGARTCRPGVLAEIRDVELLKRVVLKRSIYGVDQNPMAVELAKLGLWLDAFVPGPAAVVPRPQPQTRKQPCRRDR